MATTKKRGRGRPPKGSETVDPNKAPARPRSAKARMAEYLKFMPKAMPNDIIQLETMLAMENEMRRIQKKIAEVKDELVTRKLSEAYTNYSKEYRQILTGLGIDRAQRSTDIDMQSEVDKLVNEATLLVETIGIQIKCSECQSDFEMGTIIFHFRDDTAWLWQFICPNPKCGKLISIASPGRLLSDTNATAIIEMVPDAQPAT